MNSACNSLLDQKKVWFKRQFFKRFPHEECLLFSITCEFALFRIPLLLQASGNCSPRALFWYQLIHAFTPHPSINQPFIASITFLHIYWDKKGFKVSSNIVSHKSWHSRASYIGIIHYCTVKAIRYNCIFYEEPIEASSV